MDPHPLVDAVEHVRVGVRSSRRAFVRHFLGMPLAPVHAQPERHRKPVVRLVGMEELEVLVLANQLFECGSVNDVSLAELLVD
jgi:hypothetical protein